MEFVRRCLDLAYPHKCALCGLLGLDSPCAVCISQMEERVNTWRDPHRTLDQVSYCYFYSGRAAQAVQRLKYSRSTSLAKWMANQMYKFHGHMVQENAIVIPVPIHWTRRNHRGFNQSDLLSEPFGDRVRSNYLKRTRSTPAQAGLSHEERLLNLDGAFSASKEVKGKSVFLIDDVVTSGGTAIECSKALKAQGALQVSVISFCGIT